MTIITLPAILPDVERRDNFGLLPAASLATLALFYLIWAAMHDIAHGEEDTSLEFAVLVCSVPAFGLLYRAVVRHLTDREQSVWLTGTALLILLFGTAAVRSVTYPTYPADSMLGAGFLAVAAPILALLARRLVKTLQHRP